MKDNLLISACLLGVACRYDGQSKPIECIERLKERYNLIPVCPEILGGLPTPRIPSERRTNGVFNANGQDVTQFYEKGAFEVVRIAKMLECKYALLKEKSPACGCGKIYDGSFTKVLTDGNGVAAEALMKDGISVIGESRVDQLLK